jgi:hypothetical protein
MPASWNPNRSMGPACSQLHMGSARPFAALIVDGRNGSKLLFRPGHPELSLISLTGRRCTPRYHD